MRLPRFSALDFLLLIALLVLAQQLDVAAGDRACTRFIGIQLVVWGTLRLGAQLAFNVATVRRERAK